MEVGVPPRILEGVEQIRFYAENADIGEGVFRWDPADLSDEVQKQETVDGGGVGGALVAPSSDPSGASGAFRRLDLTRFRTDGFRLRDITDQSHNVFSYVKKTQLGGLRFARNRVDLRASDSEADACACTQLPELGESPEAFEDIDVSVDARGHVGDGMVFGLDAAADVGVTHQAMPGVAGSRVSVRSRGAVSNGSSVCLSCLLTGSIQDLELEAYCSTDNNLRSGIVAKVEHATAVSGLRLISRGIRNCSGYAMDLQLLDVAGGSEDVEVIAQCYASAGGVRVTAEDGNAHAVRVIPRSLSTGAAQALLLRALNGTTLNVALNAGSIVGGSTCCVLCVTDATSTINLNVKGTAFRASSGGTNHAIHHVDASGDTDAIGALNLRMVGVDMPVADFTSEAVSPNVIDHGTYFQAGGLF